jgi:hypothetical protein
MRISLGNKLDADLVGRLRARMARTGETLTALLERGSVLALAEPEPPPPPPPVLPAPKTARPARVGPVPPPRLEPVPVLCRRCGHADQRHWLRGCVGGCACSERRFQPAMGL